MEVDESGSGSEEEEKPTGVKRRSQRKEGEESDVGEVCIDTTNKHISTNN